MSLEDVFVELVGEQANNSQDTGGDNGSNATNWNMLTHDLEVAAIGSDLDQVRQLITSHHIADNVKIMSNVSHDAAAYENWHVVIWLLEHTALGNNVEELGNTLCVACMSG